MAYVRKRGNQLAIVHGERNTITGKVEQRILFTIYSKPEAKEIIGKGDPNSPHYFMTLLSDKYPTIKLNWRNIRKSIEDQMHILPSKHEYRMSRLQGRFRSEFHSFFKQICLTDPQHLIAAATLIQENQFELEFLNELIEWRLYTREQNENQFNQDNDFYWRYSLRGNKAPPEVEEMAEKYYSEREYEKAKAIFTILTKCFEDYAEGYNYLGLIALEEFRLDDAIDLFEKTAKIGRTAFSKRISRDLYWMHLSTRPYMRGMRNLAQTLNQAGRFDEALKLWDQMEKEWGRDNTSIYHRSIIALNTQDWEQASELALLQQKIFPSQSFIAAFALFELGKQIEAATAFLHGQLNRPFAARWLFGKRTKIVPTEFLSIEDYNNGIEIDRSLIGYWAIQKRNSKKFFKALYNDPHIVALRTKIKSLRKEADEKRSMGELNVFNNVHLMETPEFAQQEVGKIAFLESPDASK